MRVVLILFALVCHCMAVNIQVEYYTEVILDCDETEYNFTQSNPASKYWLLPDGNLTKETNPSNKNVLIGTDMSNLTLTIKRLDDSDFGWYYCIIVWNDHTLDKIRHGVNVDGAYFGDLLEKYRHNAMIGGIAAAILFAILAGSCIIWHCRYRRNDARNQAVDDLDKAIEGFDTKVYDNMGAEMDGIKTNLSNSASQQDDKL